METKNYIFLSKTIIDIIKIWILLSIIFITLFFTIITGSTIIPCEKPFTEKQIFNTTGEVFISFVKQHIGTNWKTTMGEKWESGITKYVQNRKWTIKESQDFLQIMTQRIGIEHTIQRLKYPSYFYAMNYDNFYNNLSFYDKYVGEKIVNEQLKKSWYLLYPTIREQDMENLIELLKQYLIHVTDKQLINIVTKQWKNFLQNKKVFYYFIYDIIHINKLEEKLLFLENHYINTISPRFMETVITKYLFSVLYLNIKDFQELTNYLANYFGGGDVGQYTVSQLVIQHFDYFCKLKKLTITKVINSLEKITTKDKINNLLKNQFIETSQIKLSQLKPWTHTSASKVFIKFANNVLGLDYKLYMGDTWEKNIQKALINWTYSEAQDFLNYMTKRIGKENTIYVIKNYSHFRSISYSTFITNVNIYDKFIGENIVTEKLKNSTGLFRGTINEENLQKTKHYLLNYFGGGDTAEKIVTNIISRNLDRYLYTNPEELPLVVSFMENYFAGSPATIENQTKARQIVKNIMQINFRGFILAQYEQLKTVIEIFESIIGKEATQHKLKTRFTNIVFLNLHQLQKAKQSLGSEKLKKILISYDIRDYNRILSDSKKPKKSDHNAKLVFVNFVKKHLGKNWKQAMGEDWEKNIQKVLKSWTQVEADNFLQYMVDRIGIKDTIKNIKKYSYFRRSHLQYFLSNIKIQEKYLGKNTVTKKLQKSFKDFPFKMNKLKEEQLNNKISAIKSFFTEITVSDNNIKKFIDNNYQYFTAYRLETILNRMSFVLNILLAQDRSKENKIKSEKQLLKLLTDSLRYLISTDEQKLAKTLENLQ